MQASDRPEFERQVAMLFAAYNVPPGDRSEAYWKAFNVLGLVEFARMIEFTIGPDGPEKLPTVPQLWKLRKSMKAPARPRRPGTQQVLTALIETALHRWPLTEKQIRMPWNWIAHEPEGHGCALLGVIVPQDPDDPDHYPARRLMVEDLVQQPP